MNPSIRQRNNHRMELASSEPQAMPLVVTVGCRYRFRFRSAFDSYSVACEAFSEKQHPSFSIEEL
ncbi:hypothetical protein SLEP1_g16213 [Rubroshorea leprosula]|uniref:Uncharacterized protein n=1 Tax=Rubroshorea leprosula TaxID=152421 RepID=A0AAV5IQ22_9ROSI|nr:hypothetical protein SLEP1_g16213 [Rubroshorea leprosula]